MYYTLGLLLTVSHLVIFDWQISVCLGHGVEGPCPLETEDRESLNLQVVNPVPHYTAGCATVFNPSQCSMHVVWRFSAARLDAADRRVC